jgi:PAS domain-containing protein
MIVAVPVFARGELAGYVAGVFRFQLLFQNLLASNPSSRYGIAVRSSGETVFEQGAATRQPGLKRSVELAVGSSRWNLEIAPTEALVVQARSPVAGALLVAGAFLAILLAMLAYLIQKGGARAGVDAAPTGLPAPLARFARKAALPVVSYRRDGALLAFNEAAKALFGSAPPDIPACGEFRVLSATIVRAGANSESVDAFRQLLESCAEPALVFGAEGQFIAANRAAAQTLGWPDSLWSGRTISGPASGRHEALTVQNVVVMQGEWELSRSRASAATA